MRPDPEITGVILVGGKSARMGKDKAFLQVDGVPLFERVLTLFRESFSRVILVGDREERFAGYGVPVVRDIYPGSSLGGLYTALHHATPGHVFVSPCDLPFPGRALLKHICSLRESADVVVPRTRKGYEPLFALYSPHCLGPMKELLAQERYRIERFYPQVRVRQVAGVELTRRANPESCFLNINTPEDFKRLGERFSQRPGTLWTSEVLPVTGTSTGRCLGNFGSGSPNLFHRAQT
jgi:molybdopterin-guanine dinucleotide biosynthesis protein A